MCQTVSQTDMDRREKRSFKLYAAKTGEGKVGGNMCPLLLAVFGPFRKREGRQYARSN